MSANATAYTNSAVNFRSTHLIAMELFSRLSWISDDAGGVYEWSRNPPKTGDKPQLTHSHVFTEAGTYNVTLSVTDNSEESTVTTVVVTIINPPREKVRATKTSGR